MLVVGMIGHTRLQASNKVLMDEHTSSKVTILKKIFQDTFNDKIFDKIYLSHNIIV